MFGRYQIIGPVGGSSAVSSAIDVEMGRRVAIKMLATHSKPPTAPLVHRNLVTVFDVARHEGRPYLVMEWLDGAPLVEYLEQGAAPTLDAKIDLVLQVCDGLQAAHDHGVVHGGLTAHQVFVAKDGCVKLLNLGLAAGGRQADDVVSAAALCGVILGGDAPQDLKDALAGAHPDVAHLRAAVARGRHVRNSGQYRTQAAAFDRYQKVEALIDERRALGRRLKIADIERVCDDEVAQLAARFPSFARSTGSGLLPVSEHDETAALAELQQRHNDQLAAVAVLRVASGAQ